MGSAMGSGSLPIIPHPCLVEVSPGVLSCQQPFEYPFRSTQSSVVGQLPEWAFAAKGIPSGYAWVRLVLASARRLDYNILV
jgi:hypothetical protein